jgi:hypothetical protein
MLTTEAMICEIPRRSRPAAAVVSTVAATAAAAWTTKQ